MYLAITGSKSLPPSAPRLAIRLYIPGMSFIRSAEVVIFLPALSFRVYRVGSPLNFPVNTYLPKSYRGELNELSALAISAALPSFMGILDGSTYTSTVSPTIFHASSVTSQSVVYFTFSMVACDSGFPYMSHRPIDSPSTMCPASISGRYTTCVFPLFWRIIRGGPYS